MRFLAIGQEAEGVVAIGQQATGVIAIGQLATGVVAIGQVARGVVAVGMMAFGVVSIGMLAGGLVYAAGMLGVGGRGRGWVLPLVPVPRRRPKLPELVSFDALRASRSEGWITARLRVGGEGAPELVQQGAALPVSFAPSLVTPAANHGTLASPVIARLVPKGDGLWVEELKLLPGVGWRWLGWVVQLGALAVAAYAYWDGVLVDLGDVVVRAARALLAGQVE